MRWVKIQDHSVRVDADGPEVLVSFAKVARDTMIPDQAFALGSLTFSVASCLLETVGCSVTVLWAVVGVLLAKSRGYSIWITQVVHVPGETLELGESDPVITNS